MEIVAQSFRTPDTRPLRQALSDFATGVTVVTARGADGTLVGMTVNSFASVSLDPPMVLWSLTLNTPALPAWQSCTHYAVNILAETQRDVSQHFARKSDNKFAGIKSRAGAGGTVLLPGCAAWFECRIEARIRAGDHLIMLAHVEHFHRASAHPAPLLFHHGKYRCIGDELHPD